MWYEVIGDEAVKYVDESGQERRANPGTTINVERRSEAKKLRKEGRIKPLEEGDAKTMTSSSFMLRDGGEPVTSESKTDDKGDQKTGADELTEGALVQVGDKIGQVTKVNPKTVDVKFDDAEKPERKGRDEVEVVG